jgi:hypothetical protein
MPARWRHWHHGHYRPGHWWRWATAGAVTGWVVHGWTTPVYYSYGPGGNVYYEDDTVYVDGRPAYSDEEYYQQAADIVGSVPTVDEEKTNDIEWMPLGVFAVVQDGDKESNLVLQLAVSKEGIISGTLFNELKKSARAVEGMVDKETQRAAWSLVEGKNSNMIMETGIYNLTKDETTVLVHLGPNNTLTWTLVRLDEPADDAASGEAAAAPSGNSS